MRLFIFLHSYTSAADIKIGSSLSNKISVDESLSRFSKFIIFCLIVPEQKASLKLSAEVSDHLYFADNGD